jgi:hypothetical protein
MSAALRYLHSYTAGGSQAEDDGTMIGGCAAGS